jgi:CYTH domain-containing protein
MEPAAPVAVEIERKYLVPAVPDGLEGHRSEPIQQGYLAVAPDGVEVRLRRRGESTVVTVKSGPADVRVEEEIAIDERRFSALWPLTAGRRLSKTRYYVPVGEMVAEVDVYDDHLAGLITAEVEFPSLEASGRFAPPAWLGREVTGDTRYANQSLAAAGGPPA